MILFSSLILLFLGSRCHCGESGIPPPGTVKLNPPTGVTAAEIGETYAFIFWYPPQNYPSHNENEVPPRNLSHKCGDLTTVVDTVSRTFHSGYHVLKKVLANATEAGMAGKIHTGIPSVSLEKHLSDDSKTDNTSDENTQNITALHHTIKTYLGKEIVPIGCDKVDTYFVSWRPNGAVPWTRKSVPGNITEYNITGLQPNVTYQFNVSAFYITATIVITDMFNFTTGNDSLPTGCVCSRFNFTKLGCDTSKVPCGCKEGYAGAYCENCASGYYNLRPGLPCYKCPCDLNRSSGTCKMAEGYLYCDYCKDGHSGNLCSDCSFGYYRYKTKCIPCQCHNNSDFCNMYTGQCHVCRYNTTGFSCERCLRDYVGDPIHHKNCTHRDDVGPKMMHPGMIAGICIAVILVLCAIVGCIVYRKWKDFPASRPFWTVELKGDHEGVNFSNVPEDELMHRELEDLEFYEDQGGRRNKKGVQKYAPLHEST